MPNNPTQAISEVREALEKGPTPGPWDYFPATNYDGYALCPRGTLPTLGAIHSGGINAFNYPQQTEANAAHIAACNPSNITAILEDHDRLTKRVAELEEALRATETATTIQGYAKAEQLRRAAISRSTT